MAEQQNPKVVSVTDGKVLVLSDHAVNSISERNLSLQWVERTVRHPEWTEADPRQERQRRYRAIPEYDNRIMRIVCFETEKEIRIITAFFDRKAKRP